MILCIQRVSQAQVTSNGVLCGQIEKGIVVLTGIAQTDTPEDVATLAEKTWGLRIFEDSEGKTNLSLADVHGEILCISQFTLLADCRRGRRPGFSNAARPEKANEFYQLFIEKLNHLGANVKTGIFQTDMKVNLTNDGPFTIILDSETFRQPRRQ